MSAETDRDAVKARLNEARALLEESSYAEAESLLAPLDQELNLAGFVSAETAYLRAWVRMGAASLEFRQGAIAEASTLLGDALDRVKTSLRLDAGSSDAQALQEAVRSELYKAVSHFASLGQDRDALAFYDTLRCREFASGEETHVTAASCLHRLGQIDDAQRVLEAILTLAPRSRAAWTALSEVAKKIGDAELEESCELELSTLEPFALPRLLPELKKL
ncbi:MAG: tetratricopeptide repeat protein [Deltaproteobacteria bacterium]|nr:tetratricopeptide repeat protein [Deltaproteobacteria bacterium]